MAFLRVLDFEFSFSGWGTEMRGMNGWDFRGTGNNIVRIYGLEKE
jgi:hypothetical protein